MTSADAPAKDDDDLVLLGGHFFGPSYVEVYANAWRRLLPNAKDLGLAVTYLQRHTFELLLKDMLRSVLAARDALNVLDELFGTIDGAGPLEVQDVDAANATHSFSEIIPSLERNLTALGWPKLPDQFHELWKIFDSIDGGRPDRLRFDSMFNRKNRTREPSFASSLDPRSKKTHAPVRRIGAILDEIIAGRDQAIDAVVNDTDRPKDASGIFYSELLERYEATEYYQGGALAEVETSTRNGTLEWKFMPSMRLDVLGHRDLDRHRSKLFKGYFEADFRGRPLALVIVKPENGAAGWNYETGFYLAARRFNGTLTPGVWPEGSHGDLVHAVQEALHTRPLDSLDMVLDDAR